MERNEELNEENTNEQEPLESQDTHQDSLYESNGNVQGLVF